MSPVTTTQVLGDPSYFTLAELRASDPVLADVTKYPDAALGRVRSLAQESLEDACGVAFVPRSSTETVSGDGSQVLFVSRPYVRSLTAAAVGAIALNITGVTAYGDSGLYRAAGWPAGLGNVQVTYEHGYTAPPLRVAAAAKILARTLLLQGPVSDRATQISGVDGAIINLATPGFRGATFGLPEVDVVVAHYSYRSIGVG